MPGSVTDWGTALLVTLAGLVLGAVVLFLLRRSRDPAAAAAADTSVKDLEARRDVVYAQLQELELAPGPRSPEEVSRERRALELEAARMLKSLDERRTTPAGKPGAAASASPAPRPSSAVTGFAWGVLSMAAAGGLLYFVAQRLQPRTEGGVMTGSIGPEGSAPGAASDNAGALRSSLERDPQNLDLRLRLVRSLLRDRDLVGVFEQTEAVLQMAPGHPEALSYQALVRVAMGQPEMARDMLERAIKVNPDLADAYLHLALAQVRLGETAQAQATIDTAAARFPASAALFRRAYEEMMRAGQAAATAGDGPNPEGIVGRASSAAPAGAAPPAKGPGLAGVVELDPGLTGSIGRGATVFIAVREAGIDKGPPVAVKRLSVDGFPLRFSITDADSMAGESLPDSVRIDVRVDSDGNPATREPNDPKAALDEVAVGRTDLRLVLRR